MLEVAIKIFLPLNWEYIIAHLSLACHIDYYGTKLKKPKAVVLLMYYSEAQELGIRII